MMPIRQMTRPIGQRGTNPLIITTVSCLGVAAMFHVKMMPVKRMTYPDGQSYPFGRQVGNQGPHLRTYTLTQAEMNRVGRCATVVFQNGLGGPPAELA